MPTPTTRFSIGCLRRRNANGVQEVSTRHFRLTFVAVARFVEAAVCEDDGDSGETAHGICVEPARFLKIPLTKEQNVCYSIALCIQRYVRAVADTAESADVAALWISSRWLTVWSEKQKIPLFFVHRKFHAPDGASKGPPRTSCEAIDPVGDRVPQGQRDRIVGYRKSIGFVRY